MCLSWASDPRSLKYLTPSFQEVTRWATKYIASINAIRFIRSRLQRVNKSETSEKQTVTIHVTTCCHGYLIVDRCPLKRERVHHAEFKMLLVRDSGSVSSSTKGMMKQVAFIVICVSCFATFCIYLTY